MIFKLLSMKRFVKNILMGAALLLAGCSSEPQTETDRKVEELLGQMTLREKVGQMNQLSGGAWLAETAAKGEVGSILNCVDPAEINAVQRAAAAVQCGGYHRGGPLCRQGSAGCCRRFDGNAGQSACRFLRYACNRCFVGIMLDLICCTNIIYL